ncbi:MAG: tyrosine-protein phosphatase [Deltaproteobacteria bacterium]|nr:tyrosine-protein phosphatase [Deltaproteobacteria bacterium]
MSLRNDQQLSGIAVERLDNGVFRISWDALERDERVRVFAGDSPHGIDMRAPVAEVRGGDGLELSLTGRPDNPYFKLIRGNGPGVVWAQRRLPLEKTYNFRDIGGYRTKDNRRMRWGMIYRSANLSQLTDNDHLLLKRIGIRLVCDFRTREEAQAQPDRLPQDESMQYLHMPIAHGKFDPAEALDSIKKGDISWLTDDFMTNNYLKQVDRFPGLWKQFFERLMDNNQRPLLFHCTAGKDRTGVCTALIMLTAGVPEPVVIADHQLSNTYNAEVIGRIEQEIKKCGIDPEKMRSYLTAPREAIEAVLERLRTRYGSAEEYLIKKAGLARRDLQRLRREITTDA